MTISELGKCVLGHGVLGSNVIQCILSALWWSDTISSQKAASLMLTLVKYWSAMLGSQMATFPNQELASYCLINVLHGLQVLGRHEANSGLLYFHLFVIFKLIYIPPLFNLYIFIILLFLVFSFNFSLRILDISIRISKLKFIFELMADR